MCPARGRSKKKAKIVEAAADLFRRFGIRRVTVEEICRVAGASKMTFYKYFPNKIALLRFIWRSWVDAGYRRLDEIDALDIPFIEKMRRIIEYKMELISSMKPEFIEEVLRADPEFIELIEEMKRENFARWMEFVEKAQARGDMRAVRPEMCLAYMDKALEIMRDERLRSLYPNSVDFIREAHDFLFFGLLPEPCGDGAGPGEGG
jgi:AcrR family transcriptional regulator